MLNKLKQWKRQQTSEEVDDRFQELLKHPIPGHIAIIMDGNGRWAKKERCQGWQDIMKA